MQSRPSRRAFSWLPGQPQGLPLQRPPRRAALAALASLLLPPALAAPAAKRGIKLTAFHWAPYAGPQLEQQGALSDTLRRAFAAMGYTLHTEFHSARRAVALAAAAGSAQLGYFPELYSEEIERRWLLSEAIGLSPLGLAQRSGSPLPWSNAESLQSYVLGVAEDEVIPGELGQRVANGLQRVERAADEVAALLLLASGRVDMVLIDSLAFASLMGNDGRLSSVRSQLVMNPRLLEYRSLHLALRRSRDGQRIAAVLAQGLRRIGFTPPNLPLR